MDQYTLMRMSEALDDDAYGPDEIAELEPEKEKDFRETYRDFYDDVKVNISEDW